MVAGRYYDDHTGTHRSAILNEQRHVATEEIGFVDQSSRSSHQIARKEVLNASQWG
jgi:hypothetical protein